MLQVSHMPSQADEQTAVGLDHRQPGQHGSEASGTQRPISPDVKVKKNHDANLGLLEKVKNSRKGSKSEFKCMH